MANLAVKAKIIAQDLMSRPVIKMAKTTRSRLGTALLKVRKQAEKLNKRLKKLGGFAVKVAKYGAAMTAAFAGFAVKKFIDSGDEIAKFSRQVGISAERLQELRYASERAGVGSSLLDSALAKLNKRRGQLQGNQGALFSGLKKVDPGLLRQLKAAKDNEAAFNLIVKAIDATNDPAKKAAIASAAFSNSGLKMTRMAEGGTKALADLSREAHKYGLISTKQSGDAESGADAILNLKRAFAGLSNTIGAKLVPILTPMIQQFADWIAQNRKLVASKLQKFISATAEALKNFDWESFKSGLTSAITMIGTIAKWFASWKIAIAILAVTITSLLTPALITMFGFIAANPITILIAGIAMAVIGLASIIYRNWEPIKEWFSNLWDAIGGTVYHMVEIIKNIWDGLKEYAVIIWDAIGGTVYHMAERLKKIWSGVKTFLSGIWESIKGGFMDAMEKIKPILDKITKPIKLIIEGAGWVKDKLGFGDTPTNATTGPQATPRQNPTQSRMPQGFQTSQAPQQPFNAEMKIKVETDNGSTVTVKKVKTNANTKVATNVGTSSMAYGY